MPPKSKSKLKQKSKPKSKPKQKPKGVKSTKPQDQCSPLSKTKKTFSKTGSCLTPAAINSLYLSNNNNSLTNNELIDTKNKSLHKLLNNKNKSSKQKIDELRKRYKVKYGCTDDSCIVKHAPRNHLKDKFMTLFRPEMPDEWYKQSNTWLTNHDIDNVMKQYEEVPEYKFKFLDTTPVDFYTKTYGGRCIAPSICELNVERIKMYRKEGIERLGIVFNADRHNQSGSHWMGMFIGINPRSRKQFGIYYMDSNAQNPPKEIQRLIENLKEYIEEATGKKPEVIINKRQIQKTSNTECGMFCLYFLEQMMKGKAFKDVIKPGLTDEKVFKLRPVFFLKSKVK
jgi:hypothetical protein